MIRLFATQPTLARALVSPVPDPVVAPLAAPALSGEAATGLDLILEGFLLHHGTPRLVRMADDDRILAGDFCYAEGLVRVASVNDLRIIRELSDLIALSASLVATHDDAHLPDLWRATVAVIAHDDPARSAALAVAKEALRLRSDLAPLTTLAATLSPTPALDEVFDA